MSIKSGVASGTAIVNTGNISGRFAEKSTDDNTYTVTSYAKVTPAVDFTTNSPQYYCTNITFNGTATGGKAPYNWSWDFGDGSGTSYDQNTSYHYSASGTFNVTLTVTDDDGCTNLTTKQVEVLSKPSIRVTKSASPTSGAHSTDVNFTIVVTNTGDCILDPVKVVDTLPSGLSYVNSYPNANDTSGPIVWDNVGPLSASGGSTTLYLIAHIDVGSGTLNNTVNATGKPPTGDNVSDDGYAVVTRLKSGITVNKTASPTIGTPCTNVTFTINVTNIGDCTLDPVKVVDMLPANMSYVSSSPTADAHDGTVTWDNVGPLGAGNSTTVTLIAHIDEGASGNLTDIVTVRGKPPTGDNVTASDTADVTAINPSINVTKTAYPTEVSPCTNVRYTINVTNTGDWKLKPVRMEDTLPTGMSYVSSSPEADVHDGGPIVWYDITDSEGLIPEATITVTLIAHVDEGASGVLVNNVVVNSTPPTGGEVRASAKADITIVNVHLKKTGSPAVVKPGGTVNYTITYKNTGTIALHNVVITEHYPKGVTFISASPAPDAGTNNVWTIGTLLPGESGTIVINVKVPEQIDLSFTETGSVIGEGVVMITKDLSTEQKPYSLRNRVTLSCTELAPVSAFATTKVSGVPGTSLGITESGSGVYSSDENLDLETKNRTIILKKSTHAEYKPTSFNFSDSFSVNFTNKWKQDICSRNMEIDAAIHKKISDATYIDDETISRVDKDKSVMSFDSSFNGSLYIGARTKYTAISETYIGEFDVLQTIHIGKGPIPTPAPTPTPTPIWLPCPFNTSQENTTEEAEPTP